MGQCASAVPAPKPTPVPAAVAPAMVDPIVVAPAVALDETVVLQKALAARQANKLAQEERKRLEEVAKARKDSKRAAWAKNMVDTRIHPALLKELHEHDANSLTIDVFLVCDIKIVSVFGCDLRSHRVFFSCFV